MNGTTRKATITEVRENYTENGRRYVGHVAAVDETGMTHLFMNGSYNRVLDAAVGDEGTVTYRSDGRLGLWYYTKGASE